MALYVYVDNSNVQIEGQRVSAVRTGKAPDINTAMTKGILDKAWGVDFGRLYNLVCPKGMRTGRAVLLGSRPPPNDEVWERAELEGWKPIVHDRNVRNKEKKVDVQLAVEMTKDCFTLMRPGKDEVVLVAGDGDFVPVVEVVQNAGYQVRCYFWEQANVELRGTVNTFTPLDPYLDQLRGAAFL